MILIKSKSFYFVIRNIYFKFMVEEKEKDRGIARMDFTKFTKGANISDVSY